MPNSPELLIHYLACFKAGIVAVPLNYRYTPHEIRHALRACGASTLLASSDRDADIASLVEDGALRLGVISSRGSDQHCHSFELLAKKGTEDASFAVPGRGDPAVIFFTSGSTGPAKGVTHSYYSLGWVISNYIGATHMGPHDAVLLTGSMSHIGAFLDCFCPLAVGGRTVVPRSFDAGSLLQMIRLHSPSVFVALPVALFDLVRHDGACAADFASVRLCGSGGDKVSSELHREVASRVGLAINEQYGMTETGISAMHSTDGRPLAGPLGKAIPGYKFSVRDEGGAELPAGQQGRLWVNSRANMIGYWGDQRATDAVLRDGWLDTGDVVSIDPDGYVWFNGRRKQLIIHDGSNISPQEVEDALLEHPAVAQAGVIGVADAVHGENVAAFVTLKGDATGVSPSDLIIFARKRVGYKAPETISVIPDMPLTSSGKVDRAALKELAVQRRVQG